MRRRRRHVARWVWLLVVLVVAWVAYGHRRELREAAALLAGASIRWLAPGALAIGGVYLCRACVYRIPLRLFGYDASIGFLWRTALVATSIHQLVPVGGISGYAFLTWAMGQRGVPAGQASLLALIDTLSYGIATATLVVASLVYLLGAGIAGVTRLAVGFGPAAVVLVVAVWLYRLQRSRSRLLGWALRWQDRVATLSGQEWSDEPIRRFVDDYYEGKRVIGARPRAFWHMIGFQYLALACDTAALYAAFAALSLLPAPWTVVVGFTLAMSGMAVIGAPGGGGSFETIMSAFFATHGLETSQAIAAAILYRVLAFWLPVIPTLFVLWALRRRRREIRRSRAEASRTG